MPDIHAHWLPADALPAPLDPVLHAWLYEDRGSLTQRLTELADGAFGVQPLDEGWQVLRDDECQALGIPAGSAGWVREVYLYGGERPWVYARSVAGREALVASGFDIQHLGSRSLGELLFSDRAFARGTFETCRYPAAWLPPAVRQEGLWARRSCFSRDSLGVLVAEVFLPAFWARAQGTACPPGQRPV
ncbi:chorismate--pyruvate lyase family protein [Stutzerimonas azotifigens]|uniref:chorismate--pyruvate lyase family protein n=1 Tax=Stutzerimonas azotifigens TaxID=291995 RepID=UPI000483F140|nr:chorismate lyase [Stutzerimonas azotifigens]